MRMTVESILEQLKKKQITPDEARKRLAGYVGSLSRRKGYLRILGFA